MSQIHYLTVQDVLWINLQVTKKVQHFQYARLEEATYYQYAYGPAQGLLPQASRFAAGMGKLHPFEAGNEATAFVGAFAFLRLNGLSASVEDGGALSLFRSLAEKLPVEGSFAHSEGHGSVDPRSAINEVLSSFPCSVLQLASHS